MTPIDPRSRSKCIYKWESAIGVIDTCTHTYITRPFRKEASVYVRVYIVYTLLSLTIYIKRKEDSHLSEN